MARGYGRTLDFTTLMVLLRNKMQTEGMNRLHLVLDLEAGFTAYLGERAPAEQKFFETHDSALLALLIGNESVPGIDE